MTLLLAQSTAITVLIGPALDKDDFVTPETALSPTVYLSKNGGAQAARNSASAIAHDRDGFYRVPLDTTDTNTLGVLVVQFSDATTHLPVCVRYLVVSAIDTLNKTVPGSYASGSAGFALGRIGSGSITTVSLVAQSGDVTIVQGDDYNVDDGRQLDWTESADGTAWPVLTGATITFTAGGLSKAGSVVTATGSSKKVRVQLTSAETATLAIGTYAFDVQATLATNSRKITLVSGELTVSPQITA